MNDFATKWMAEYDRALKRLDEITAGITDAQGSFKPGPKKWSLSECTDHLCNALGTYLPHMLPAADKALATGIKGAPPYNKGTLIGRFILAEMRRPTRMMSVPSPKPFKPSKSAVSLTAAKEKLRVLVGKVRETLERTQELDLGRIRFGTPAGKLVRVSMAQAFEIHGLHLHRHLDQMERVKAAQGFPAA